MSDDYDYYGALKDQRYKQLLDKEIQLDNARQRAYKNTNLSLAAAGMESSGFGQLARQGVEQQYLGAMQNAKNSYNDDMNELNQQQYAAQKEDTNAFLSLMGNDYVAEQGLEGLNTVFSQRGFLNGDGSLNMAEIEKMYGKKNAADIATSYQLMANSFANQGVSPTFENVNEAIMSITDNNGKTGKSSGVYDEVSWLFGNGKNYFPAENGTVVMLKANGSANAAYTYLMYKDGGWQQVDSSTYKSAASEDKYELYSDKNTHLAFNIKHNGKVIHTNDQQGTPNNLMSDLVSQYGQDAYEKLRNGQEFKVKSSQNDLYYTIKMVNDRMQYIVSKK